MRFRHALPISLIVLLGALFPSGTIADVAPGTTPIDVAPVDGAVAIRATGTVAGAAPFRAAVYAAFAPELPTVLLTRRALKTDAGGHFDTTIPIAPAYFRGTIITVIVRTAAGVVAGHGSTTIEDPPTSSAH